MKKLLMLLTIGLLFVACDKNNEDEKEPYYNPVEGAWSLFSADKQLINTRVFTHEFETYYTVFNGAEIAEDDYEKQTYRIKDGTEDNPDREALIFMNEYGRFFTIKGDTLFLEDRMGGTEVWLRAE